MRSHLRLLAKASLLVLAGLIFLTTNSTTYAQKLSRLVESVDVQGNRRLRDEDILDYVKTRPGEAYSSKQIQKDLEAIISLGLFEPMQTRVIAEDGARGGVAVIFEVMELPIITGVTFEGLKHVEESDVIGALRGQGIIFAKDSVYDVIKLRAARQIIREFLASRGWANSTVEIRQEEMSANSMKITFIIDEKQ
jgi:outer membrane protein insertion porin family